MTEKVQDAPDLKLPDGPGQLFSPEARQRLVDLRHDLHRQPELSLQEERTAARLYDELARLGPKALERVAGTGVVARVAGKDGSVPPVAVRGDIDALPIQEATGLPFASTNPGVMHACGHDVHATWAVGAASLLAQAPARGDVLIVLQPAEEVGQGARKIVESGTLAGAAAIFGGHVDRRFAVGEVVVQTGPVAAAADDFKIELRGRGAHGARPQEGMDPVVGAATFVSSLQTLVSRRLDPATPGVVTVGVLQAGTAANIIPERATLAGTMRSVDPETRRFLEQEVRSMAEAVAATYHLEAEVSIRNGTPPLINAEEPTAWARAAVTALLGEEALVPLKSINMGGEDFAYYTEEIPGCFLRIGAREEGGKVINAHTPYFYAADGAIFVGAAVLAEAARVASDALARQ